MYAKIILDGENDILITAISPENQTMLDGEVISKVSDGKVITTIHGKMSIGRLMNTIDDVINTAILSESISSSN